MAQRVQNIPDMHRQTWRVLLVEDTPGDAFAFQRAVQECAPEVQLVCARDLGTAREIIDRLSIDTLFLDLSLPDGSGLSLLDWLKRDAIFARMPAIVLTSSARESDRAAAEALGADGFYTKPDDFDDLVLLIAGIAKEYQPRLRTGA